MMWSKSNVGFYSEINPGAALAFATVNRNLNIIVLVICLVQHLFI